MRNTVGNVQYVGVLFHSPENVCYWMGHVAAYAAIKGVIVTTKKSKFPVFFEKIRVAEAHTNIVLRWGSLKQRIN